MGNGYAAGTIDNRSRLKRFSHGRRYEVALSLIRATPGDRVLDVGTGDGYLLRRLVERTPGITAVGYDPVESQIALARRVCHGLPGITLRSTLDRDGTYQWVTCFETLEHLAPDAQLALLRSMREAVTPTGRVVVSVPLEIGLPGLAKNVARLLLRQRHQGGPLAYLRATIGLPSERPLVQNGYIYSHVGFSHRPLRRLLSIAGFTIERTVHSPLPLLGWLANSQVFWVLRHR